jgi:UDP-glucose 4-epimerase
LGAVRNRRSLISLDNLIDLILAAMNHPFYGYRLGLAADDRDLSSAEIAGAIAKGMGVTPWLPPVPIAILKGLGALTGRAAAAQRLVADLQVDNGDAKSAFDWRPEQDPAASLALTGAACRDNAPSLVKV